MGASTLVSVEVGGGPKTAEERPHGHGIHEAPLEPPGPGLGPLCSPASGDGMGSGRRGGYDTVRELDQLTNLFRDLASHAIPFKYLRGGSSSVVKTEMIHQQRWVGLRGALLRINKSTQGSIFNAL